MPLNECGAGAAHGGQRVLIVSPAFPPAFLQGGPARSLGGIVETLGDDIQFWVVTSASDGATFGVMPGVEPDRWVRSGRASVWYSSRRSLGARSFLRQVRAADPHLVYLNSLFNLRFTILPLLLLRLRYRRLPVLLAPRGELSPGALQLKARKKTAFLFVIRMLKLHRSVGWHATTDLESADIGRVFGESTRRHIAPILRPRLFQPATDAVLTISRLTRESPSPVLVYFSRIVEKKNLARLLDAVRLAAEPFHLVIAGPIEDARYWERCKAEIELLPPDKVVSYVGPVPAEEVVGFLASFDLFVLPTFGENFGHVVLESLAAGTPVIVGRDTPWGRVETSGAGWLCDPTNAHALADRIDYFLRLDAGAVEQMRANAVLLAHETQSDPRAVLENQVMFRAAAGIA